MKKVLETVKNYLLEIKKTLLGQSELTEQEKLIIERVKRLLNDKDTVTVMAPGDRYYLVNEASGKTVKVTISETIISDQGLFLGKSYTARFQETLSRMIRDYIESYTSSVDQQLVNSEIKSLQEITPFKSI